MATVKIRADRCKGCALCVDACPKKIIALSTDKMNHMGYHTAEVTEQVKCIGCAFCAVMCPDTAIEINE